jgi:hypothetical protein
MYMIFANCNKLKEIIMNNSDYGSVNKIIVQLPTRTSDSIGTLNIAGVDYIDQVNMAAAEAKYWNVVNSEESVYFVLDESKLDIDKI